MNHSTYPFPKLAGVSFTHLTVAGVVGAVAERIAQSRYDHPLTVFTPNVEQLIQARQNRPFWDLLQSADIRIPDSVGLVWADWWRAATRGQAWKLHARVTGVDAAEKLLSQAAIEGWKVVLIGGTGITSATAVNQLKKRFSGLDIWSVDAGVIEDGNLKMEDKSKKESSSSSFNLLASINELRPDLLLVGLGAPKQEGWVIAHRDQLHAQAVMVVGGAIDMWAGRVKRAPAWLQRAGLEWLFRLVQEPWRLTRQLRLIQFIWLTLTNQI